MITDDIKKNIAKNHTVDQKFQKFEKDVVEHERQLENLFDKQLDDCAKKQLDEQKISDKSQNSTKNLNHKKNIGVGIDNSNNKSKKIIKQIKC